MRQLAIPVLGVGIGFRSAFAREFRAHPEVADFVEVTADHYLDCSEAKWAELKWLASRFTVIPHGLELSIGSAEGVNRPYLEKLVGLVAAVQPPYFSEHLSFCRAGGVSLGHFAPLPFNEEALAVLERNIGQVQAVTQVPLVLENVTYSFQMPGAEMNEGEFIARLVERTGVGILLDVTNLYTNSVNFKFDPLEFLAPIPPESVVQLHFTGGEWSGDTLIDSHSAPTPEPVFELMDQVLQSFPVKGVILERDDKIPPLAELAAELSRARAIGARHGRWPEAVS